MKTPRWVALAEALLLHDMQLVAFGGAPGVRDLALLESALARPQNVFSYGSESPHLARLAAAYAFAIVKNHPFIDGNKRAGLVIAFAFLELNGVEVLATEEDAYRVFMDLASGKLGEQQLAAWIESNVP